MIASGDVRLELAALSLGDVASTVASAADAVRTRFASRCPKRLTLEQSTCLGMCAIISNRAPVIEFMFDRTVARVACASPKSFELNSDEWCAIVARSCATRPNDVMLDASRSDHFLERVASIENALQCTLSESNNKKKWDLLPTRVAVVLCFQTVDPPYPALGTVFGSVVRSDIRRCDDVHSHQHDHPMDIITLSTVIEAVARAALST
jgi:hypothetical protein